MPSNPTSKAVRTAALTEYYENIVAEMKAASCWSSPRTRMQVLATARNLFRWLAANGHANLSGLRLEDVRAYYMHRVQAVTYPKSAYSSVPSPMPETPSSVSTFTNTQLVRKQSMTNVFSPVIFICPP